MSQVSQDEYSSPLVTRYAGSQMRRLFSPRTRIESWRHLWIWLAEAEQELGLDVTDEQIAQMKGALKDIDFAPSRGVRGSLPPRRDGARACLR